MPRHNFARPTGQLVELTLDSAALRENLLGDPSERTTAVYLPPGYDESDEDYPLFVCLAGFLGSGLSHLGFKIFGESLPQRLDRLVREGEMGPVVMAFP
ncbi:MAG: enterochelin esterase, partial [Myxococcota bacterium]|nr:enterochelin esterase [Myxococcota bacterium]